MLWVYTHSIHFQNIKINGSNMNLITRIIKTIWHELTRPFNRFDLEEMEAYDKGEIDL